MGDGNGTVAIGGGTGRPDLLGMFQPMPEGPITIGNVLLPKLVVIVVGDSMVVN